MENILIWEEFIAVKLFDDDGLHNVLLKNKDH